MEEKKLTDEEIKSIRYDLVLQKGVAGLDGFASVPHSKLVKYLDLIDRLQSDYSNLKERYVKVLGLNEKVIAEQKAEIERLTEERQNLLDKYHQADEAIDHWFKMYKQTKIENAELQKQVDELKEEREHMQAEIIATEESRLQAVKDTVKEILGFILAKEFEKGDYLTDDELKKLVGEKYGVEVE